MAAVTPCKAGNLPSGLSSFIGRRRELREVKQLLGESRLVTLTGPGGTGKTRLSLRVGAELRRAFPGGVWFVDLTQLHDPGPLTQDARDPDGLAFLVAATLGLHQQGRGSPLDLLAERLAGRQLLLILDNCEHLIPACALVADALLRGCPDLRILATSREPLIIAGEAHFAVPPLPAPDPRQRPSLAELSRYESVELFVARAQGAVRGFRLSEANHVAVAELCHRLDGLPLAIQLAAAQTRVLTLQQILGRLTDRFTLLSDGTRGAPERQQTLRACVDWSFDLCSKPERMLWARLSVFAGGFELDAVEGICADENLPAHDLLDLVAGLVDKSILIRDDDRDGHAEQARYRMLETIREYGEEKLIEAGEDAVLRHRHRDWHRCLVARASAEWVSDRQAYWLARLAREHPNLRAAVEACLTDPGQAEPCLRLAVSLPGSYWRVRGLFGEGRRWLDHALAKATAPTTVRARALVIGSQLAFWQGDATAGVRLLDEGEELARRLGGTVELAHAAFLRGTGALYANDLPVAIETLGRARTTLSRAPNRDLDLYLYVVNTFCVAAGLAGDQERATALQREVLAIVEPRGEGLHRSLALWAGGLIAWLRRDLGQAAAQVVECLRLERARGSDDRYRTALCLEALAWIATDQQQHRRAATLLGAADAFRTDLGTPITGYLHLVGYHNTCERRTRDALGDAAFTDAFQHGRALTFEDVLTYALDEPRQLAPAPQEDAPTALTPRERQVADLLAQGLSNKEIANRLVISQRTAESHVEHILSKFGLSSRAQVAARIAEQRSGADNAHYGGS
jgi:predicted ATPase/DNA-binding CsgD family transcriptional regulator